MPSSYDHLSRKELQKENELSQCRSQWGKSAYDHDTFYTTHTHQVLGCAYEQKDGETTTTATYYID